MPLSATVRLFQELGRQPSLLLTPRWVIRNHRFIYRENRWLNSETGGWLYRNASYCIDCRKPILSRGICAECAATDQFIQVPEPNADRWMREASKFFREADKKES